MATNRTRPPGNGKRRSQADKPEELRSGFGRFISGLAFVLWLTLIPALVAAIVALFAVMKQYQAVRGNLEQVVNIELPQGAQATRLYARDYDPQTRRGTLLASLHVENRQEVDYTEIPPQLLACFLSTEDARFFEHKGVDIRGTGRALRNIVLRKGEVRGGGSTITQQLARNVFLPYIKSQKTLNRKIQEVIIAGELERKFSKQEIVEAYLNHIYLGASAYGVKSAAETYFGKSLDQLTLDECAMLAGLPQSPSHDDPYKKPDNALARRDAVLRLLDSRLDEGFIDHLIDMDPEKFGQLQIDHAEIATATKAKIKLNGRQPGSLYYRAPYFCDYVLSNELIPMYGKGSQDNVFGDGLTVVTTIDPQIQEWAEEVARKHVDANRKSRRLSQVAVIVLEAKTGEVLACVGGYGWGTKNAKGDKDKFNRAFFMSRQVGSSFKPFTYATAYEQGFKPETPVNDNPDPELTKFVGKRYPNNSDGKYFGWMSMARALQHSRNAAAVDIIWHLTGPDAVISTARKMGLHGDLPPVASLTLGVADVTPIEMAEAFDTFPNMGIHTGHVVIKQIYETNGMLIMNNDGENAVLRRSNRALTPETTYKMVRNLELAVNAGTGTAARVKGVEIAGKTGTCEDFGDAWFVGFSPEVVCAVWVGNDDFSKKMKHGTFGNTVPAPIFQDIMEKIYANPAPAKADPKKKAKDGEAVAEPPKPTPAKSRYRKLKFVKPDGVEFKGFGGMSGGNPKGVAAGAESNPDADKKPEDGKTPPADGGGESGGDDRDDDFYKPWQPPPEWDGGE
jgi:penicillin-binding protein 1A